MNTKKTIKICCEGETKRLKISGDYAELINRTRESFNKQAMSDSEFKFFYLDDEQEVISITSQADLTEALNIEDLSSLKLTVAANMQEALKILYDAMVENKSIASISNQSQIQQSQLGGVISGRPSASGLPAARSRFNSEYDQISAAQNQQMTMEEEKNTHRQSAEKKPEQMLGVMPVSFQRQAQHDCDSSNKGSVLDNHNDGGQQTNVMVVGMGMQAKDLHNATNAEGQPKYPGEKRVLTCTACKGTKLGSRGKKPCKTCKGTGLLSIDKFEGLMTLVREELSTFMENSMREILQKHSSSSAQMAVIPKKAEAVEECKQAAALKVDQLNPAENKNELDKMLDAELVISSIPDEFVVHPGQEFTKEWTFKNNGAWQWPSGVQLIQTEGDKFITEQDVIEEPVKPDEQCKIVTKFRAPQEIGSYISYFRLMVQRSVFGQKVWCNIVVKNQGENAQEEAKQQPEPVIDEVPAVVSAPDKEMKDDEKASINNPVPLAVAPVEEVKSIDEEAADQQLSQSQVVKNKYELAAQKKERVADYMRLFEFGFTDFVVNEYLLEKYDNIDTVAEMLMSGQVSIDTINSIYASAAQNQN